MAIQPSGFGWNQRREYVTARFSGCRLPRLRKRFHLLGLGGGAEVIALFRSMGFDIGVLRLRYLRRLDLDAGADDEMK